MKKTTDSSTKPTKAKSHPFWQIFWLTFLVVSLAYAWYSFYVPKNDVIWVDDYESAQQLATKSGKNMLLFFTADWCVPCRIMKREVFADEAVEKAIHDQVVAVMLYEDAPGADKVFQQYKVGVTPVTLFTDAKGNVLDYAVGKMGKKEFLEMMKGLDAKTSK